MILHGNPGGMHFSRAVPGRDWAHRGQLKARRHQKMLEVFSDASYGANADHRTIQGLVVCYAGVPIAWQCGAWHIQQQRRSSLPTANHWLLGKPRKLCYTHTPKSLQCLRLTAIPNQNARHDPCPGTDLAKPLSPLETLALTSLDQTIMVLFVLDRIPSERRFPTGLFAWALLTPTNKNAKQALFLVCILQDGF